MNLHDVTSTILRSKHADISVPTSSEWTFATLSTSPASSPSPPLSTYEHVSTPYIGQVFTGDEIAYNFYKTFAKNGGFSIRRHKATRNRAPHDKSIVSRFFVCHSSGFPSQKLDKSRIQMNTPCIRCRCGAGMEIKRLVSDDSRWIVTHFTNVHNHDLLDPEKVCLPHQKITEFDRTQITILAKAGVSVKQIVRYLELEHGVDLGALQFLEKDVRNFLQSLNLVVEENEQDLSMLYSNASVLKINPSNSNQIEQQVQTLQSIASEIVTEFSKGRAGFEFIRDEMTKVRDLAKRLQLIGNIASNRRSDSLGLSETDGYNDGRLLSYVCHPFLDEGIGGLADKNSNKGPKLLKKPRYCKVPACGQPGHDSRNCPIKRSMEMDVNVQAPLSSHDPMQAVSSAASMNGTSNGGNYSKKKLRHCKVPSCGQAGHDSRNCPMKRIARLEINDTPVSNGTCTPEESRDVNSAKKPRFCKVPSCGQSGHDSRNCPMRTTLCGVQSAIGLVESRVQTYVPGPSTDGVLRLVRELAKRPRYCKVRNCGQSGHDSRNCPLKKATESEATSIL